jgi:hypothetical protein
MLRLLRNPIPGRDGATGAPTFEVAPVDGDPAMRAAATGSKAATR